MQQFNSSIRQERDGQTCRERGSRIRRVLAARFSSALKLPEKLCTLGLCMTAKCQTSKIFPFTLHTTLLYTPLECQMPYLSRKPYQSCSEDAACDDHGD